MSAIEIITYVVGLVTYLGSAYAWLFGVPRWAERALDGGLIALYFVLLPTLLEGYLQ